MAGTRSAVECFTSEKCIFGRKSLPYLFTSTYDTSLAMNIALLPQNMVEGDVEQGQEYEDRHVHTVYDQIASHFSSTRYKPWPIVERFLLDLPAGSIGVDVGCGNGKYLPVNRNIFIVASDRSKNLVEFAVEHEPHDAIVADTLILPHPKHAFDFAISIAVVHHLSTPTRRREALRAMLDLLKRGEIQEANGKVLIFVWALEQKNSRRGWSEGDEQDVMVPWVLHDKPKKGNNAEDGQAGKHVFHRYYHLYRAGELDNDIEAAGGIVLDSGYERDNWWAIAVPAFKP